MYVVCLLFYAIGGVLVDLMLFLSVIYGRYIFRFNVSERGQFS